MVPPPRFEFFSLDAPRPRRRRSFEAWRFFFALAFFPLCFAFTLDFLRDSKTPPLLLFAFLRSRIPAAMAVRRIDARAVSRAGARGSRAAEAVEAGRKGGAMVLVSPSLLFFVIKREQGKPPRPPLPLSALCSLRQYSICSLAEEAPGSFRCSPMRLRKKDKSSKGKGRATTRATSPSGGGGGGGRRRWSLARRFSASSSVSSFGCLWSSCSVPLERR